MRVAYVVNQYPQTSQSFIRREIAALEAMGIEVERFSLRRGKETLVEPSDLAERVRTRYVLDVGAWGLLWGAMRVMANRPGRWVSALWLAVRMGWRSDRGVGVHLVYLAEACVLLEWLREWDAEHVHAHFGTNSTMVPMLCRAMGGPSYSFTAHGPEEFDRPMGIALGEKIRRATFVVAISSFGRSQLCRWCPVEEWGKIHVVHCGVDEMFLCGAKRGMPRGPRLLCVGRLAEQKGQLLLLEAAARLRDAGVSFELKLAGDGPMREELEKRIAQLGLGQCVKLAGWMSGKKVREEMEESRAVVLASFAEGLPVVIMESLALGRPVVSTNVGGIAELVEAGVSGWVVTPGSVEALAKAMREVMEAEEQRLVRMGLAGAAKVAREHDAKVEAGKLAGLFRKYVQFETEKALPIGAVGGKLPGGGGAGEEQTCVR